MFIPASYREEDQQKLVSFMQAYPFATFVTGGVQPLATHLPVVIEAAAGRVKLISHMAMANPQWQAMREQDKVLVVFQGPQAYISATFYPTPLGVPTWNYAAVHVYGKPVVHVGTDESHVIETLQKTISAFEPGYHNQFENMPKPYKDKLMQELVAFEIEVTSMEGAFKLSQDKSVAVQQAIAATLAQSSSSTIAAVGNMMQANVGLADE